MNGRAIRHQHDDHAKYVAYVLWVIGHSYSTIGKVLHLKRSQVGGIINRSAYAGRSSMTISARTAALQELKAIRLEDGRPIDGGLLDKVSFQVI